MLISTFNTQLKNKHPQAEAYIPEKIGKRQNLVCVTYSPNSKVYEYTGTILSIAQRLNLIPQIDNQSDGQKIANLLKSGQTNIIGYKETFDTIQYYLGQSIDYTDAGLDDFDRPLVSYKISTNIW